MHTTHHVTDPADRASPPDAGPIDAEQFERDGYVVLDGYFTEELCEGAARALDEIMVRRRTLSRTWTEHTPTRKSVLGHPYFDALIAAPVMVDLAREALGPEIWFHHANGRVLDGDDEGTPWHHDYDGYRSTGRWGRMAHILVYPEGLTLDNGPLLVIPGSHRMPVDRAFPRRLGAQELPEAQAVTGRPGLTVLADSGIWHRRSENGSGERRRYFQFSYCQPTGAWPEREELDGMLDVSRSRLLARGRRGPDPAAGSLDQLDRLLPQEDP
jgi:ectoine hydroxylase-related dioxygenase (phytanoyl-CoA dioxygenase family)